MLGGSPMQGLDLRRGVRDSLKVRGSGFRVSVFRGLGSRV